MNLEIGTYGSGAPAGLAEAVTREFTRLVEELSAATGYQEWGMTITSSRKGVDLNLYSKEPDFFKINVARTFGKEVIEHSSFSITEEFRNKGLAETVLSATDRVVSTARIYKNALPLIELDANLDVGAYAWLRRGVIPDQGVLPYLREVFTGYGLDTTVLDNLGEAGARLFVRSDAFREYKEYLLGMRWSGSVDLNDESARAAFFKATKKIPAAIAPAPRMALTDVAVQRQVLLERFKAAEIREFTPILRKIDEEIRKQLSGDRLTDFRRARLESQLVSLTEALKGHYTEYTDRLLKDLEALAGEAADFETGMLSAYVPRAAAAPPPQQLWAAVRVNPLTMTGANGGQILETFMAGWRDGDAEMVANAVRVGYALGETNDQIINRIRGQAALSYSDGVLAKSRHHAEAVARTAIQHVANSARAEVWAANDDIIDEYQWVSTLDSRTTPLCRDRDGKRFPIGKGPLPPAHPNCRSTTVAVIKGDFGKFLDEEAERASVNGPVPANETYYDWLKRQDSGFQDLALGSTRGKLFRDGGLSVERFGALQLGKNFEPMTLGQMRKLSPKAFAKAGIPAPPPGQSAV